MLVHQSNHFYEVIRRIFCSDTSGTYTQSLCIAIVSQCICNAAFRRRDQLRFSSFLFIYHLCVPFLLYFIFNHLVLFVFDAFLLSVPQFFVIFIMTMSLLTCICSVSLLLFTSIHFYFALTLTSRATVCMCVHGWGSCR